MFRLALHRIGLASSTRRPISTTSNIFSSISNSNSKSIVFEPEYLDHLKPEIPLYEQVNIQIKGYDYPVLESYQRYVHKIVSSLNIDCDESWALPPQKLTITRTEPNSMVVDATYDMTIYERVIQAEDVPSNVLPILIESIQTGLPEGVDLTVETHTPLHDQVRYVPDLELKELEKKLEEMGGPREVKSGKRK